jgi:hypothetical protein
MKTKIGLTLCALAVSAGWATLRADDSAGAARSTGRVLVLANEKTLDGIIERQGDQYRVRRTVGEVWIQHEEVLALCQNYQEALQFLRSRANLRDPDEHFRLATWCQAHGLKKEALEEARAAVDMRPGHQPSQRLLYNLQRARETAAAQHDAKAREDGDISTSLPPVNSESLSVFVTRVQPILMNTCAQCHATGRGGSFKLVRTYGGDFTSRKGTLQNLTAVLSRVDAEQPTASLFLTRAASIHGDMAKPALKSGDNPYRTLEEWVKTTLESSPQAAVKQAIAPGAAMSSQAVMRREMPVRKAEAEVQESGKNRADVGKLKTKEPPPRAEIKDENAGPADDFDPVIFNRQMHPSQKPDGRNP